MTEVSQAAEAVRRLDAAHDALRADPAVQFTLPPVEPPPKPPEWIHTLGDWVAWALRPIGRALAWLFSWLPDAPYARLFFWGALAIVAALVLWLIVDRLRMGAWRWRRRAMPDEEGIESWAPEAAPARAWLREADALAGEGRYAEAVHHLLIRSVEDISRRRPRLVRPALTSRDIAAADALPARARTIFSGIAAIVERSLFGGRAVDAADWTEARTAYAAFALAKAWT